MAVTGAAARAPTSALFDFKAEIGKHSAAFEKGRVGKAETYIKGGKRPDKPLPRWQQANKGVAMRASKDEALHAVMREPDAVRVRDALLRKSKVYEKIRDGKTGGLTEVQRQALLVDFDIAQPGGTDAYAAKSTDDSDEDESLHVPKRPRLQESKDDDDDDDDPLDPIVEYTDEFGRTRAAKQSEVPRSAVQEKDDEPVTEENVIYGEQTEFPVYEPTPEEIAARQANSGDTPLGASLATHYDVATENRTRGAAFYGFSKDEATRQQQMAQLRATRNETDVARASTSQRATEPTALDREKEARRLQIEEKRQRAAQLRASA